MPSLLGLLPVASGAFDGYTMAVGINPTQLTLSDTQRSSMLIRNLSELWPIFLGNQTTIAVNLGFPLFPGQSLTTKTTGVVWATVQQAEANGALLGVWWER